RDRHRSRHPLGHRDPADRTRRPHGILTARPPNPDDAPGHPPPGRRRVRTPAAARAGRRPATRTGRRTQTPTTQTRARARPRTTNPRTPRTEQPKPKKERGNHPKPNAPTTYRLAGRAGTCVGRVNFIAPG